MHLSGALTKAQDLELDLNIYTCWKIELHQLVNGLCGEVLDVHQPGVRPLLKVLSRVLVHMWRPEDTVYPSPARNSRTSEHVCTFGERMTSARDPSVQEQGACLHVR